MIIIFLGPPGAGKGTQAQILGHKLGLPVISVGQLLREVYQKQTPEGIAAWEGYVRHGLNVPLDLKFKILAEKMDQAKNGFILDNFPRMQEDLEALRRYLQEEEKMVDRVFHLLISDKIAISRIMERGEKGKSVSSVRGDDNLEILKTRIEEGYRKNLPVILDYFRRLKVLEEINGEQEKEVVHQEILGRLGIND